MGQTSYKNEGYLWFSDATEPIILNERHFSECNGVIYLRFDDYEVTVDGKGCILKRAGKVSLIPFIIEGLFLFDHRSYRLKMIDGKYLIFCKDLDVTVPGEEYSVMEYLPNRLGEEIEKVVMRRYWKEEADELCEGMMMLVPSEDVFAGFKRKSNS
jgi:CRISPR type III-associated protein (TIGR04423 family)